MRIEEVVWKEEFSEKIIRKHSVFEEEVEEVLLSSPHIRLAQKGRVKNEHLYFAYGKTEADRYLLILFIDKKNGFVLPITARDMTLAERRYFNEQAKTNRSDS